MKTPNGWSEDDFCECGALLDADGNCPYCNYQPVPGWNTLPDGRKFYEHGQVARDDDAEYWSWFETMDLDQEENAE